MSMKNNDVRTDFRAVKEAKELALYNEYNELMAQPGAMATKVDQILMEKYGIFSKSTIWFIRKRVEKRLGINPEK